MSLIPLAAAPEKKTASGIVYTGRCIFQGFLLGTDGTNDPVVTIYNNTAASGQEVIPTATYDASALGLNGVSGIKQYCDMGLYVEITCAGSVEVVVQYTPYSPDTELRWHGA
jgi:hypothetical protein